MLPITAKRLLTAGSLLVGTAFHSANAMQPSQIAPPKVEMMDRFHVNISGHQVMPSLNTVSIGGDMGLQHSITLSGNHFSATGLYGYIDRYSGTADYVSLINEGVVDGIYYPHFYVYRVSAMGDSAEFVVYQGSTLITQAQPSLTNYRYVALGDARHSLDESADGKFLIWTKPDGTQVKYSGGLDISPRSQRFFKEIIYPNGFLIQADSGFGVSTNTGYLLKYEYVPDHRGLESGKKGASVKTPPETTSQSWSLKNPKYIYAINLAEDECSRNSCVINADRWPRVTFEWPGGMPRAFHIGSSYFHVIGPEGGKTSYWFQAYDLALDRNGNVISNYTPGEYYSPRLKGIKPESSNSYIYQYDYVNDPLSLHTMEGYAAWFRRENGKLTSASGPEGASGYGANPISSGNAPVRMEGTWKNGRHQVYVRVARPGYYRATVKGDIDAYYEDSSRNFITKAQIAGGPQKHYYYDARSNLARIVMQQGTPEETTLEARYPATCSSAQRKYCNSPVWTKDAKGNQTDYEYHAPSGQIAKITLPPDRRGIRPQTRYTYAEYSARYYDPQTGAIVSGSPIWLIDTESYCRSSAATQSGCSNANDEVVTEYNYASGVGTSNLLLRSKTITAQGEPARHICYQYDIYGNRIGETQPKGATAGCNQGGY